jgi:hypothetical protein
MVVACLSLFIALSGVTYAATGGNFILGNRNTATSQTSLAAPLAGKALQVTNMSTATGATALGLSVAAGKTPFTVNSGTKVANLNADKLDGLDSNALRGARAWALTGGFSCASDSFCLPRGAGFKGVAYVAHIAAGKYCVGVNGITPFEGMALVSVEWSQTRFGDSARALWHTHNGIDDGCVQSEFEIWARSERSTGWVFDDEIAFVFMVP